MSNITAEKTVNMPTNEDGEFELVLGNKQLLSVFFIFIILLGVFFTMGYLVGRNSGPADVASKKLADLPATKAEAPSAMPAKTTPKPLEVTPAPSTAQKEETPVAAAPAAAAPAEPAPAPVVTKKETPAAAVEKPKPLEISPVTSSAPKAAPGIHEPAPGMYVQVLALDKAPAEVLADVLIKKGFHAMVAPGPNDKIFRVLVGPAKDQADAARLKGDLEKAGFKEAFPKRY